MREETTESAQKHELEKIPQKIRDPSGIVPQKKPPCFVDLKKMTEETKGIGAKKCQSRRRRGKKAGPGQAPEAFREKFV